MILITKKKISPFFKHRKKNSHKGSFGHLLLIGGSVDKVGAILLAGRAALRTGTGRVTVALPDRAFSKFPKNFLELMYAPLPSTSSGTLSAKALPKILKLLKGKSALGIGPGMGVNRDTVSLISRLLKKNALPTVIDADALNGIAKKPEILRQSRSPLVLTPHAAEMGRLIGKTAAFVQSHREKAAKEFAMKNKIYLLLKGSRTVIATPKGKVFVNTTGNPAMATAGSGDVLTGIISSLLAQGMKAEEAATAGAYLHGRVGDLWKKRKGDRGMLAGDLIDELPAVFKEILRA
jgi:NAD(P)H-hydrate epimerase